MAREKDNYIELESKQESFEVMKVPEIRVQEERGLQLFSLLLKIRDLKLSKPENLEWRETESPLTKEVTEYFTENPIDSKIIETIDGFNKKGFKKEILSYIALTYQNSERATKLLQIVENDESYSKEEVKEVCQKFLTFLEDFDQIFKESPLVGKFSEEIRQDVGKRKEKIEETKKRFEALIDFFKPSSKTTDVKVLTFAPTNPLYRENYGRNFSGFSGEQIIVSHIDNTFNQEHEFLHGIINPIVKKLSQQLTFEQQEKIFENASIKIKKQCDKDYLCILREEFVVAYSYFENKNQENPENNLREMIIKCYEEYAEFSKNSNEGFEDFILKKFPNKFNF